MENSRFIDAYFWIITCCKQKVHYLYKTTSIKSLNFCTKVTLLPLLYMATMKFQDGGYFGFKVI